MLGAPARYGRRTGLRRALLRSFLATPPGLRFSRGRVSGGRASSRDSPRKLPRSPSRSSVRRYGVRPPARRSGGLSTRRGERGRIRGVDRAGFRRECSTVGAASRAAPRRDYENSRGIVTRSRGGAGSDYGPGKLVGYTDGKEERNGRRLRRRTRYARTVRRPGTYDLARPGVRCERSTDHHGERAPRDLREGRRRGRGGYRFLRLSGSLRLKNSTGDVVATIPEPCPVCKGSACVLVIFERTANTSPRWSMRRGAGFLQVPCEECNESGVVSRAKRLARVSGGRGRRE